MKTYTDDQLMNAAAKELPELIHVEITNPLPPTLEDALLNPSRTIFLWRKGLIKDWKEITPREWDWIALELCKKLTDSNRPHFAILLQDNYGILGSHFCAWQQRIIAYCLTVGVAIV